MLKIRSEHTATYAGNANGNFVRRTVAHLRKELPDRVVDSPVDGECSNGLQSTAPDVSRLLTKRVDDPDSLNFATVREIFGIKLAATERASSGDDSAVPKGKSVCRFDFQCVFQDGDGVFLDSKAEPCPDQPSGDVMRQRIGSRGPGRLDIEFLQDLHRQRTIVTL